MQKKAVTTYVIGRGSSSSSTGDVAETKVSTTQELAMEHSLEPTMSGSCDALYGGMHEDAVYVDTSLNGASSEQLRNASLPEQQLLSQVPRVVAWCLIAYV